MCFEMSESTEGALTDSIDRRHYQDQLHHPHNFRHQQRFTGRVKVYFGYVLMPEYQDAAWAD